MARDGSTGQAGDPPVSCGRFRVKDWQAARQTAVLKGDWHESRASAAKRPSLASERSEAASPASERSEAASPASERSEAASPASERSEAASPASERSEASHRSGA